VPPKLGICQQFTRFTRSQIEWQTVNLGHLGVEDIDSLSWSEAISPQYSFSAIFPPNIHSGTKKCGFTHVLNLVPCALKSSGLPFFRCV
jgi:hypothetical protein